MGKFDSHSKLPPAGLRLAPVHRLDATTPLLLCLLVTDTPASAGELILVRDQPDTRTYAGAMCDRDGEIHELLEISVQNLHLGDVRHSAQKYQVCNGFLDRQWETQGEFLRQNRHHQLIATNQEHTNPPPLLIKKGAAGTPFLETEFLPWELCQDDALLAEHGLPSYSGSRFRYLHVPGEQSAKTFAATDKDNPVNAHVIGFDKLAGDPGILTIFNPRAGLIRITRRIPLDLETAAQLIEGKPWQEPSDQEKTLWLAEPFGSLRTWSHESKAPPFRLHPADRPLPHAHESLLLKVALLLSAFQEVRDYVKTHQLPLLNLSPYNFGVRLAAEGNALPRLWSAQCQLIQIGQAYPLDIQSTEQRYFLRLGTIKPTPFTPEGVGAHSFGIGRIQIRSITEERDGLVLDGTLVADDYLGLDPHDLLWFKLPVGELSLEFHAHVYKSESRHSREARFRTVPARFPEEVASRLKSSAGINFPKSPYEIWPLLSSPSDLFSLGVIAVRMFLADHETNLPAVLDEVLALARRVGETDESAESLTDQLRRLAETDPKVRALLFARYSPGTGGPPAPGTAPISREIWLRIVAILLRLFPGTGKHTYCQSFGDVSPLALETVFDRPILELELCLTLLRSLLIANVFENEEIAGVILGQMD